MTHRTGAVYSSKQFTWDAAAKTFSGEISEVPGVLRQMWNDRMELGFGIQSAKTGNTVFFLLDNVKRTEDEIICWKFKVFNPVGSHVLEGLSATIYND